MNQIHVVYGATGAVGSATVKQLVNEGKQVRAIVRNVTKARELLPSEAELVKGDMLDAASTSETSKDAAVIYHMVNVPYGDWYQQMPVITDNLLAAAKQAGAVLVFAGNVYGYGHFQAVPIKESHPLAAHTRKGKLRNAMEAKMLAAHQAGQVQVVIPRYPDFYGPATTNALIGPIFKSALAGKDARWPGKLNLAHELVYNQDAAAAASLLAATPSSYGQSWHVPGCGPITGQQFVELAYQQAGTQGKIGTLGGLFLQLASLVNAQAREFGEMLYQYEEQYILDGSKFATAFPDFKYTPYAEGVRETLAWFRQHPNA